MKFKMTMLVLLVTFLTVMVGSEAYAYNYNSYVVNKGRSYCPTHFVIYNPAKEVHKNCKLVAKSAPYRPLPVSREPYRKSGGDTFIEKVGALFDIKIWFTQVPVRYVERSYYGFGGYRYGRHLGVGGHTSQRSNLYGHNIFRSH